MDDKFPPRTLFWPSMRDRPFFDGIKVMMIQREPDSDGSSLYVSIPNPDWKPAKYKEYEEQLEHYMRYENTNHPVKRPVEPQPPYEPMSGEEFERLLIEYDVTKNPMTNYNFVGNKIDSNNISGTNKTNPNGSHNLIGRATTATISQSDKQDSINNIKRYAKKIYNIPVAEFSMDKLERVANTSLDNPPQVNQAEAVKNFDAFTKKYIVVEQPIAAADMKVYKEDVAFMGSNAIKPVAKYLPISDFTILAYIELKKYSVTAYGSLTIAKIMSDHTICSETEKDSILDKIKDKKENKIQDAKLKTFKLVIGDTGTAGGSPSFIIIPPEFPKMDYFPGGEEVDTLAVIHHEFGHTLASSGKMYSGSLIDERNLVVNIDNPARIINGKEPRYTYYDSTTDQTINIIDSSVTGAGKMTFDPKDASKLIQRTTAQSAKWGIFKK